MTSTGISLRNSNSLQNTSKRVILAAKKASGNERLEENKVKELEAGQITSIELASTSQRV